MHRKIARVATLALFVSCFMIAGCKSSEPRYNGRPLTEWLGDVTYPPISWAGPETNHPLNAAVHAVEAIGTNGVPTFIRLIRVRDAERAKDLNKFGLIGFSILGTNAQIAAPFLFTDLHSSDPGLRQRASVALDLIGYKQHHGARSDPLDEATVLAIARAAVTTNDTWIARAEFGTPKQQPDGSWNVMVWRLPKTPGGHRLITIDPIGRVTAYVRGH